MRALLPEETAKPGRKANRTGKNRNRRRRFAAPYGQRNRVLGESGYGKSAVSEKRLYLITPNWSAISAQESGCRIPQALSTFSFSIANSSASVTRVCCIVSRSRRVKVSPGFSMVSKSMVTHHGVPASS